MKRNLPYALAMVACLGASPIVPSATANESGPVYGVYQCDDSNCYLYECTTQYYSEATCSLVGTYPRQREVSGE